MPEPSEHIGGPTAPGKHKAASPRRKGRGPSAAPDAIHFLHVGKTAGTQIAAAIEQINAAMGSEFIVKHPHAVRLTQLGPKPRYFFSTRDPAARFRSGFYSRKRKGRPRNDVDWTPHEALAFARFEHANDLAEALFEEGPRGNDAVAAIRSISHTSRNLVDWFERRGQLFEVCPPLWIVRQEQFESDLAILLARIGFDDTSRLVHDEDAAHRNDYAGTPPLSEKAMANLQAWYVQDYAFLRLCEAWMAANGAGSPMTERSGAARHHPRAPHEAILDISK